ncbi:YbfB/YjiJ family MFS transporter [Streptomyces sp. SCSIO 30461]|uniref:YbfB/YjiJ family MFS transporter n=1 Tax=Streptomyces sp. SCSIO 30461 TaxID=3118085 RepID=UPI0030D522F1
MHDQAGLSAASGANLATANYVGYLTGSFAPRLVPSRLVMRASMIVMAASLALMPLTQDVTLWSRLRLIAGFTSALTFVHAVGALLSGLRRSAPHLVDGGFGGIGAGIVFSGLLVLAVREGGDMAYGVVDRRRPHAAVDRSLMEPRPASLTGADGEGRTGWAT